MHNVLTLTNHRLLLAATTALLGAAIATGCAADPDPDPAPPREVSPADPREVAPAKDGEQLQAGVPYLQEIPVPEESGMVAVRASSIDEQGRLHTKPIEVMTAAEFAARPEYASKSGEGSGTADPVDPGAAPPDLELPFAPMGEVPYAGGTKTVESKRQAIEHDPFPPNTREWDIWSKLKFTYSGPVPIPQLPRITSQSGNCSYGWTWLWSIEGGNVSCTWSGTNEVKGSATFFRLGAPPSGAGQAERAYGAAYVKGTGLGGATCRYAWTWYKWLHGHSVIDTCKTL